MFGFGESVLLKGRKHTSATSYIKLETCTNGTGQAFTAPGRCGLEYWVGFVFFFFICITNDFRWLGCRSIL